MSVGNIEKDDRPNVATSGSVGWPSNAGRGLYYGVPLAFVLALWPIHFLLVGQP